jgi:amino acid permease
MINPVCSQSFSKHLSNFEEDSLGASVFHFVQQCVCLMPDDFVWGDMNIYYFELQMHSNV